MSEIRELTPEIKITQFSDEEETVTDGSFSIIFYPQGNSSGGSIFIESKSGREPKLLYSITLDPVTGKPHVEKETQ